MKRKSCRNFNKGYLVLQYKDRPAGCMLGHKCEPECMHYDRRDKQHKPRKRIN